MWIYNSEQQFQTVFDMLMNRIVRHWLCLYAQGMWHIMICSEKPKSLGWGPVSTVYTFQGEAITSVSCSRFPVTGCLLMVNVHWLCTVGGIKPFCVIWKVSNLGAFWQLHSENDSVVSGDHQETGFTSGGFMLLIQTETWMYVQPSMSNARLDGLGGPLQPGG